MYAVDHLLTVADAARELGMHRGSVNRSSRELGTGRFILGTFRFTATEIERMRDRPDRRRRPMRSWLEMRS